MAEWKRVCSVEEVPPGSVFGVELDEARVVLANVDGEFYALEDRCSHQDFPLSRGDLEGTRLECTFHGAQFDVCSGRAVRLPAIRPVRTYEVEVRNSGVFVQID